MYVSDNDMFDITDQYFDQSQGVEKLVIELKHTCPSFLIQWRLQSTDSVLTHSVDNLEISQTSNRISTTEHVHGISYYVKAFCVYPECEGSQRIDVRKCAIFAIVQIVDLYNIYSKEQDK